MFHGGHQENPDVIKISFHLKVLAIKLCIGAFFSGLYLSVNPPHMFVHRLYK